jgi:hypothetical protein
MQRHRAVELIGAPMARATGVAVGPLTAASRSM